VIHAINFGVYEINYVGVNANLLKLKKYGRRPVCIASAGFWARLVSTNTTVKIGIRVTGKNCCPSERQVDAEVKI